MLLPKVWSPTRGNGNRAPNKVGFRKCDKPPDSERTRRQQLTRGSKPTVGTRSFDPCVIECRGAA